MALSTRRAFLRRSGALAGLVSATLVGWPELIRRAMAEGGGLSAARTTTYKSLVEALSTVDSLPCDAALASEKADDLRQRYEKSAPETRDGIDFLLDLVRGDDPAEVYASRSPAERVRRLRRQLVERQCPEDRGLGVAVRERASAARAALDLAVQPFYPSDLRYRFPVLL
jgi:hypothetical protein